MHTVSINNINTEEKLNHLTQLWFDIKNTEREAMQSRIAIEEEILAICPSLKKSGINKLTNGLKIITRLNEKWDQISLTKIYRSCSNKALFPFITEFKPVKEKMHTLEKEDPKLFQEIQNALILRPAKPTFNYKTDSYQ